MRRWYHFDLKTHELCFIWVCVETYASWCLFQIAAAEINRVFIYLWTLMQEILDHIHSQCTIKFNFLFQLDILRKCLFMFGRNDEIIFLVYKVHTISFQTFFVWALLLIVHTWNSSPLRSSLLRLQCTCCTVPTTSGRPHGSPLVWACQWPLSQPLLSPQLSHNDSFWA